MSGAITRGRRRRRISERFSLPTLLANEQVHEGFSSCRLMRRRSKAFYLSIERLTDAVSSLLLILITNITISSPTSCKGSSLLTHVVCV